MRTSLLAAVVLTSLPVAAQDAAEIRINRAVGQRWTVQSRAHMDLDLKISDLEENVTDLNLKSTLTESFSEEITEAGEGGSFRSKVVCVDSRLDQIEGTKPMQTTAGPLRNRTFALSRDAGAYAVVPESGSVDASDAARFGRWHEVDALLPGKPVKPGDSWDAPPAFVTLLFKDMPVGDAQGEVKVTFKEIVPGPNGARHGVLSLSAHVRAENKSGQPGKEMSVRALSAELAGSLTVDLDAARPVVCSLGGSVAIQGEVRDDRESLIGTVEGASQKLAFDVTFEPSAP